MHFESFFKGFQLPKIILDLTVHFYRKNLQFVGQNGYKFETLEDQI